MADWKDEVEFDDVITKAETDLALLCVIDGKERWIPKSQISDNSEVWESGDIGKLIISPWFAEKEGLD
jgi:hypothetical protein